MLRPFTQVTIQQVPNGSTQLLSLRNSKFVIDFISEGEGESTWEKHTDSFTLKFPKNINLFSSPDGIFVNNGTNNLILSGTGTPNSPNIDASGNLNTSAPLIMKGDIIIINYGYIARNSKDQDFYVSTGGVVPLGFSQNDLSSLQSISTKQNLFFGYVRDIKSNTPIEISCEDNFYLLKRTPFDTNIWNKTTAGNSGTSLYGLLQHILDLVNEDFNSTNNLFPFLDLLNIPSSITAQFSLGYLDIGDLTCGQVLDKLKQQYKFESTFKGNTLLFGFPIYVDVGSGSNIQEQFLPNSKNFFSFRDIYGSNNQLLVSANILNSHDLEYSSKDDIILSATVQCAVINPTGKTTKSGLTATKKSKLKAYIYWDIPTQTFKSRDISNGITPEKDIGGEGERHEFFYPVDKTKPNPTINDLIQLGIKQLEKYHYTGFRGCFTTFGFPFVQWNDNVNILDTIYSDRNGQYKVKKVKYKLGFHGLSQEIHLDYKIDVPLSTNNQQIYLM